MRKQEPTKSLKSVPNNALGRTEHNPRWCELGERRFFARSKWEGNYGHYLEWLRIRGEIRDWRYEPRTYWFEGIKRGTVSYKPDFEVTENSGRVVIHEVKGWMDPRSRTKLARMKKYHPTVIVHVIERREYEGIKRSVGALVPGWVP